MIIYIGRSILKEIPMNCYRRLTILRKNKRYTLIIKKRLAESLISKNLITATHFSYMFQNMYQMQNEVNTTERFKLSKYSLLFTIKFKMNESPISWSCTLAPLQFN